MSTARVWTWASAGDRMAGAVLVLMATVILWESRELPFGSLMSPGAAFMPVALASIVLICGVLLIVTGSPAPLSAHDVDWLRVPAILGAAAFAAGALERLGYRVTVFIVLLFLVGVIERRNVIGSIVFAAAMALGTFYVFDTLLRTPLPRGPWFDF